MNRRRARPLFTIASRVLLMLSLVFASGPWAVVLASASMADCAEQMQSMSQHGQHGADCCAGMDSAHGDPACGQHGSTCGGGCAAWCAVGHAGAFPLPSLAGIAVPVIATERWSMRRANLPSVPVAAALRPPISL